VVIGEVEDFIVPVLDVIESLGGKAETGQIEESFYRKYGAALDPSKDWQEIKRNHRRQVWKDYCTTRVAYYFLRPDGLITTERGGMNGPVYTITPKGKTALHASRNV